MENKIIIPEGWEIDKEKSKGNEIVLKEKSKIDFSLLNGENICYVLCTSGDVYLTNTDYSMDNALLDGKFLFKLRMGLRTSELIRLGYFTKCESNIRELRLATQEELDILYAHHPELYPQKKWEDFGRLDSHYYFDANSELKFVNSVIMARLDNTVSFKSEKTARAFEALSQLILWRDKVNGDWKPDWTNEEIKYSIRLCNGEITLSDAYRYANVISFKTRKTAEQFLRDHRDLIETAKELL